MEQVWSNGKWRLEQTNGGFLRVWSIGAKIGMVPHMCGRARACGMSALFAPLLHSLQNRLGGVVIRLYNLWAFCGFQSVEQLLHWSVIGRFWFAPVEQAGFAGELR